MGYRADGAGPRRRGVKVRFQRRRRVLAATVAALVLGLLAGCAPESTIEVDVPAQVEGPLPDETVQQLQDAVSSAMVAAGASGAIVGVWAPWSGSWVTGMGTQSPAGGAEVTADMTFRAADVTRAMTCDVLYQVVAEGAASLDDPITRYVSGFPDLGDVTLRHLCDGTSGIGSYAPYVQGMWLTNPARQWNPRELAAYGVAEGHEAQPGTAYRDSDAGYLLLGLALERITGSSMRDLIAERVAGALGLDATALPTAAAAPPSTGGPVLEGYWSTPGPDGAWNCAEPANVTTLSASVGGSDSGVVTDIQDLGRYAQALASQALTPGSDRFQAPLPVGADQPTWYTVGGGAYHAGALIGQYGSIPGYITAAFAHPETGMSIAVVLNNSGGNPSVGAWLAWELAAIASKAPAAAGQTMPEAGLPWTPQQFHDLIAANAICAPPAG